MKKNRIICLIFSCILILQAALGPVLADETETTAETTLSTEAPAEEIRIPAGQDASVVGGCRTLDGQMPLWGKSQIVTTAGAAFFYEVNSDTVVYSWNPDETLEPASLVKIMTCLIAVENGDITDKIIVSASALGSISEIFHTMGLQVGEEVTLEQMLYCMMVGSANDASVVIADHVGGSVVQFVAMMNQRAKEIGCTGTNFTNPTGLGDANQYSTARDMAKILNEAIKNPLFMEFFSATVFTLPKTNLGEERKVTSTNYLMLPGMVGFYEPLVTGGRTGITDARNRCLATTAESGDLKYITIILDAVPVYNDSGTKTLRFGNYEDTQDLLDMGFKDHKIVQVLGDNQIIRQYPVTNGTSQLSTGPADSVITLLPSEATTNDLTVRYVQGTVSLNAPVDVGEQIDTVQLWYKNVCVAQSPLIARNYVAAYVAEEEDNSAIANTKGLSKALIIIGMILGFVLCIVGLLYVVQMARSAARRAQHRRRRKNRRRSK